MKKITIVVLALLMVTVSLGISSGCATDKASVDELSKALKHCYALYHYNPSFDQFTVKDLEVISKTTDQFGTHWSLRAKLYDPNGRYVEAISGNVRKISLGFMCE